MKDFTSKGQNALRRLEPGARALYGAYLALTALGLVTAALLHFDGMGASAEAAATWWRGDGDVGLAYPKSYRQIVELTHFHRFTEPVALLVVAHLYVLGGDLPRRKVIAILATTAAMVLQIALPWLTVYGSGGFAILFLPVTAVVLLGFAYMIGRAAVDIVPQRSTP